MTDPWNQLASDLAEKTEAQVTARLSAFMQRFCRENIKVIFSEKEAAAFLGVGRDLLAGWRKRGLIQYAVYPQRNKDELGDIFTYSISDLLNFRERYIVHGPASNVYELDKNVSVFGPEVKKLRAA